MSHTTQTVTEEYPMTDSLSRTERYSLLSSAERRATMRTLEEKTGSVPLPDLAAAVVAAEEWPGSDDTAPDSVAAMLHHVHLPKMDAVGVIEYDAETNVVYQGPETETE